ncbi:hypothetical protein HU200_046597 [Digitaria exilis]|uniref:Uncharacterized protein n=1 Tax=Digitaria exilis TaxID=1010633 RepID=A0A835AY64_9POAL|nr:hypothetical protein HU200_046597 [Digitaria exilis]
MTVCSSLPAPLLLHSPEIRSCLRRLRPISPAPRATHSTYLSRKQDRMPSNVVGDDESKLTIIFCTVKCYCHDIHGDAICYCCQKPPGPVCYDKLADCQANCPICNPECPPVPPLGSSSLHE